MIARNFSRRCSTVRHPLAAGLAMSLLMLTCFGPLSSQAQTKSPYSKEILLEALRRNAQTKDLSLKAFVDYIQQRGVDFEMTTPDEARFRNAGASPEVITAIRQNYRAVSDSGRPPHLPRGSGALTINSSPPGCEVFINGQARGLTSEGGILRLPPMKSGSYKIALKKKDYEEQERSVTINPGANEMESFALTPMKGSLTVVPNFPDARVSIREIYYPNGVKNLNLPPDIYEVRVAKPGYKPITRVVTIAPGQAFSLSADLEPMSVEEMVAQGMSSFQQRNYQQAIAVSRDILSAKPDEPKAHWLLGMSSFYSGDYDNCISSLVKAISLGERVELPIQRHSSIDLFKLNDGLTPGVITISKNLLQFQVLNTSAPVFSVPFDKVYRVSLEENNRGGRVQVKVGNPDKKKDSGKDYDFHPIQASLRQVIVGNSVATKIYCENCVPPARAIYQVLLNVKALSETGTPGKP